MGCECVAFTMKSVLPALIFGPGHSLRQFKVGRSNDVHQVGPTFVERHRGCELSAKKNRLSIIDHIDRDSYLVGNYRSWKWDRRRHG